MLDWNDLRYFLSVARHRQLSSAAHDLKVSPSTVSRRLTALEAELGVRLLNRTPEGYVLTLAGMEVRDKAEILETETLCLRRSVGNRDEQLSGVVRITCAESVASHLIAPCLPRLHAQFPGILVELIPDVRHLSLAMREADIALRIGAPDQQDVVGRRVGSVEYAAYASEAYLKRRGHPDLATGSRGHCAIQQVGDVCHDEQSAWFGGLTCEATRSLLTCSHEAAVGAALEGGGLACLASFRARKDTRLIALSAPTPAPSAELWLVLHKDNRQTLRMRTAADHIAEHLRASAR